MNKWKMALRNLNANQKDQQFVTPIKISQTKQIHPWTEERPTGHITP